MSRPWAAGSACLAPIIRTPCNTRRQELAQAYLAAGRLKEAAPLSERTLADCARVLGDDHPLTGKVREAPGRHAELTAAGRPGPGDPAGAAELTTSRRQDETADSRR